MTRGALGGAPAPDRRCVLKVRVSSGRSDLELSRHPVRTLRVRLITLVARACAFARAFSEICSSSSFREAGKPSFLLPSSPHPSTTRESRRTSHCTRTQGSSNASGLIQTRTHRASSGGIPPAPATAHLSSPGRVAFSTHHPCTPCRASQLCASPYYAVARVPPSTPSCTSHARASARARAKLPACRESSLSPFHSEHILHSLSTYKRTSGGAATPFLFHLILLAFASVLSHSSAAPSSLPVQSRELISCLPPSLGPQSLVLASSLHSTSAPATLVGSAIFPFSSAVLSHKAIRFRPLSPP